MLKLTLKLGVYREDLFKEYIERPTEYNQYLIKEDVVNKIGKAKSKL